MVSNSVVYEELVGKDWKVNLQLNRWPAKLIVPEGWIALLGFNEKEYT